MDDITIAHALFDAIGEGGIKRFTSLFTNNAVIWHNVDQREQPVAEVARTLEAFRAGMKSAVYEERRYEALRGGAIAQHVLRVTTLDGRQVEVQAIMRVFVENGLIYRVEEYFEFSPDSAHVDRTRRRKQQRGALKPAVVRHRKFREA